MAEMAKLPSTNPVSGKSNARPQRTKNVGYTIVVVLTSYIPYQL